MRRLSSNWRLILRGGLIVFAVACCVVSDTWACPTCKEDLANDPQGRGLATGFYYSILLMMTMPFAIIGMLGAVAYRSVKRAQAERDATSMTKPTAQS